MRIIVFSDSHGNIKNCIEAVNRIKKIDMIIHTGDIVRDAEDLKVIYPNIPVQYVAGNNDYAVNVPYGKIINIQQKKIFITHGHLYRVRYEYDSIVNKGVELGVEAVLFGHTHQCYKAYKKNILLLNPGSISIPAWGKPSYAIIEIDNDKIGACICNI